MIAVVASYRQLVRRLSDRRRRLRGGQQEHRPPGRCRRGQRPARRLRDDGRGVGLRGRRQHHHAPFRRCTATRVRLALGFVVLLAAVNLRGVREAGHCIRRCPPTPFASGGVHHDRHRAGPGRTRRRAGCRSRRSYRRGCRIRATRSLGVARADASLALRAFSSGCTALTGVEAIANGVPAFRPPKASNAQITLLDDGRDSHRDVRRHHGPGPHCRTCASPRTRVTWSASVDCQHRPQRTVIAQRRRGAMFGGDELGRVLLHPGGHRADPGPGGQHRVQRLPATRLDPGAGPQPAPSAAHARATGWRTATASSCSRSRPALLIVIYQADVTRLIQLYIIGVFTSFTLGQTGHGAALEPRPAYGAGLRRAAPDHALPCHQRVRRVA